MMDFRDSCISVVPIVGILVALKYMFFFRMLHFYTRVFLLYVCFVQIAYIAIWTWFILKLLE